MIKLIVAIALLSSVCNSGIIDFGLVQTDWACASELQIGKAAIEPVLSTVVNFLKPYAPIPSTVVPTSYYLHIAFCHGKDASNVDQFTVGAVQSNGSTNTADIPCDSLSNLYRGTFALDQTPYKIISIGGKYLTISATFVVTLQAPIQPLDDSQAWYLHPDGHIISKKYPDYVLDVKDDLASRTQVIAWTQKVPAAQNQLWVTTGPSIQSQKASGLNLVADTVTNTNYPFVDFVSPAPVSVFSVPQFDIASLTDGLENMVWLAIVGGLIRNSQLINQGAQFITPAAFSSAINVNEQCAKANYPQIPPYLIDLFRNSKSARGFICETPDLLRPTKVAFFGFSLSGKDVSDLCPEGALFEATAPLLFANQPAVWTISAAYAISALSIGATLATVVDPDGAIIFVVTTSLLPPGVSLDPVTGRFFVTQKNLLVAGTYSLSVTTTDVLLGQTTSTVVIKLTEPVAVASASWADGPGLLGLSLLDLGFARTVTIHAAYVGGTRTIGGDGVWTVSISGGSPSWDGVITDLGNGQYSFSYKQNSLLNLYYTVTIKLNGQNIQGSPYTVLRLL